MAEDNYVHPEQADLADLQAFNEQRKELRTSSKTASAEDDDWVCPPQGVYMDFISEVDDPDRFVEEFEPGPPTFVRTEYTNLFYHPELSQKQSSQILKHKRNGDFLIRKSSTPRALTLVVRVNGATVYCFGSNFFLSIQHLVNYHRCHSLGEAVERWQTTLGQAYGIQEYHDEDPAAFSPAGMRVPIVYFDEGFDISVSKQAEPSPSGELKLCLPTAMRPKPEARSLPSAACSTNVLLDMFLKK